MKSKIFTALVLFLLGLLVWNLVSLWPKKIAVENRLESLEEKIARTESSNVSLAKLLDYFKSSSFLEREAKIKLNLRRPDENVVFIAPVVPEGTLPKAGDAKDKLNVGIGKEGVRSNNNQSTSDIALPSFGAICKGKPKGTLSKAECVKDKFNVGVGTLGIGATNFEKWVKYLFLRD